MKFLITILPYRKRKLRKHKRRLRQKNNVRRYREFNSPIPSMLLSFSQERFARELAYAMNDLKSLMQYRKFVRDIPAEVLAEIKEQVLSRNDVKNRGAYFTTLVKLYEFDKKGIKPENLNIYDDEENEDEDRYPWN